MDISLCQNATCPLRGSCYRYNATPDPHRQSYAHFEPDADGKCDDHLELRATPVRLDKGTAT